VDCLDDCDVWLFCREEKEVGAWSGSTATIEFACFNFLAYYFRVCIAEFCSLGGDLLSPIEFLRLLLCEFFTPERRKRGVGIIDFLSIIFYMKPFFFLSIICLFASCYSFKGISIPPEVNTFSVENFDNRAIEASPGMAQQITLALKDKIRNESRLKETSGNEKADVEFSGFISRFETQDLAPRPGEQVALNELKIYVKVEVKYREKKFIESEFNQTFNHQVQFPADQNLLDVQDVLVEEIFEQITSDVFQKAFTSW